MDIKADITLNVDSEAVFSKCKCEDPKDCNCLLYTIPIRAHFSKENGFDRHDIVNTSNIEQRKGEAEMAQVDWLKDAQHQLKEGDGIVNYVTSADIDTIVIHFFALSLFWPRKSDNTFKYPVYVWLQKNKPEIYDITSIIEVIENRFKYKYVGALLAILLSMGGNDYLPNFHGISNEKLLNAVFEDIEMLTSLVQFQERNQTYQCILNVDLYFKLYSKLYYPNNVEKGKFCTICREILVCFRY